jgi:hypothetical protein
MASCKRRRPSHCSNRGRASCGYWYQLAMPGLVLDRSGGSVRLEVSLHEILECLR